MLVIAHGILVEYNMYMQLGVAGLRALENYMVEERVSRVFCTYLLLSLTKDLEMGPSA